MGDDVPNSDPVIAEEVKEEIEPVGVSYMVVGDLIIVGAQILVACQVVFEEKFVRRYEVIHICNISGKLCQSVSKQGD